MYCFAVTVLQGQSPGQFIFIKQAKLNCSLNGPIYIPATLVKVTAKSIDAYSIIQVRKSQKADFIQVQIQVLKERKKNNAFTLLFRGPRRDDLASGAWQDSHSPVATCMMKHTESPYLISGTPMPSMSLFGPVSPFSCSRNIHRLAKRLRQK